jgi:hypothetical protein
MSRQNIRRVEFELLFLLWLAQRFVDAFLELAPPDAFRWIASLIRGEPATLKSAPASGAFPLNLKHGGHITVNSTPGAGTKVSIYLPAAKEDAPKEERKEVELAIGTRFRALLMDSVRS